MKNEKISITQREGTATSTTTTTTEGDEKKKYRAENNKEHRFQSTVKFHNLAALFTLCALPEILEYLKFQQKFK